MSSVATNTSHGLPVKNKVPAQECKSSTCKKMAILARDFFVALVCGAGLIGLSQVLSTSTALGFFPCCFIVGMGAAAVHQLLKQTDIGRAFFNKIGL